MTGIEYDQVDLSKNTSELVIKYNEEEFVISNTKENIEKLNNVLAHMEARVHGAESEIQILKEKKYIEENELEDLKTVRNILNKILMEDIVSDYDINVKEMFNNKKNDLMLKYDDLKDIIVDHDYHIVTAEEFYAYCNKHEIECPLYTTYQENIWFKNIVKEYFKVSSWAYTYGEIPNFDVDASEIESRRGKAKVVIDKKGGIKELHFCAKAGMRLNEVGDFFEIDGFCDAGAAIGSYLKMYGFKGWKDFYIFANNNGPWNSAKEKIIANIKKIKDKGDD